MILARLVPALLACAGAAAAADTYQIDPVHSSAVFKIGHLGVSNVWGRIVGEEGKMGSITVDADAAKDAVKVVLPAAGVDTHNEKRDQHLKGPDFFDAKQFAELSFESASWKARPDGAYDVAGTLTIHGVAKPLTVVVKKVGEGKDPWGGTRIGFDTEFAIKRSDFGIKTMPEAVGDDVTIYLSLEGVRK